MVGSAMAHKVARALPAAPRKPLAMGFAAAAEPGEGDRKKLAEPNSQRAFGVVLARAFALANLTQQEVAFRLGYTDQSAVSRWVAGTENAQIARLLTLAELRGPLVMAIAEMTDDVSVETVVRLPRRRA